MMRPQSSVRCMWDCVLAVALIYIGLATPLLIGFPELTDSSSSTEESPWRRVDRIINYFFIADILMNFRTGYMDREIEVLDWRAVAHHYLTTWFLLDVVSSLPIDLLIAAGMSSMQPSKLLKSSKVFKVFRLLSLGRFVKIIEGSPFCDRLDDFIADYNLFWKCTVLSTLISMAVACHWMSCFLHYACESFFITNGVHNDFKSKYIAGFYWAMTTITTVGYGDLIPSTSLERMLAMPCMVFGGCFYGSVISTMSSCVFAVELNKRIYEEKMIQVNSWLRYHGLPSRLTHKVRRYFKKLMAERAHPPENAILNDLSPDIRNEVIDIMIPQCIRGNPVSEDLPAAVWSRIVCLMNYVACAAEEYVVESNEPGYAMFIIKAGDAVMRSREGDSTERYILGKGSSFGEEVMVGLKETYGYEVQAQTRIQFSTITKDDFLHSFKLMPEVIDHLRRNIQKKMAGGLQPYQTSCPEEDQPSLVRGVLQGQMPFIPPGFAQAVEKELSSLNAGMQKLMQRTDRYTDA